MKMLKRVFACTSVVSVALLVGSAHALPVFVDAAGNSWRQLAGQSAYSWEQIDAICANDGVTACGAGLDGSLEGWVWATSSEVATLFQQFGTHPGTAYTNFSMPSADPNIATFFTDFTPTTAGSSSNLLTEWALGWIADFEVISYTDRDRNLQEFYVGMAASVGDTQTREVTCDPRRTPADCTDFVYGPWSETSYWNAYEQGQNQGAWLFRAASTTSSDNNPVPEPATLALVGIALAGIGVSRRNKLS